MKHKESASRWIAFLRANKLKGKVSEDDNGELVVYGTFGQLFEHDEDHVGAMYMVEPPRKGWKRMKDKLLAVGAVVSQNGDMEGVVLFEFNNGKALRAACSVLKIANKRSMTPAQREAVKQRFAAYRASQ